MFNAPIVSTEELKLHIMNNDIAKLYPDMISVDLNSISRPSPTPLDDLLMKVTKAYQFTAICS